MEPTPVDIAKLALTDPVSAYALMLGVPRTPYFMTAQGTFSSLALNQLPIDAPIDSTVSQRTWICRIDFALQCPNAFPANALQSLYIASLKASPGVSVTINVLSGPKYDLAPFPTPLENVTNAFNDTWPSGWLLYPQQSIKVSYQLTAAPAAAPYTIATTFSGWQFLDPTVDTMCADEAVAKLAQAGIVVPNIRACKR